MEMPCLPQGSRPFAWYNVRTTKTEHPSRAAIARSSFHWLLPALWPTTMGVYQPVWQGGLLRDDGAHLTPRSSHARPLFREQAHHGSRDAPRFTVCVRAAET
jgi:hypothetical protein